MKNKNSGSGGGSADLTPIYNSLSALSLNKLESTAFTFFTNTLTISGAGLPYQIDFTDVSVLSANSGCLYNITDTISGLSLTTASIVKITGPETISNNSFNMKIFDFNAKDILSNTITLSGTGEINAYRIFDNSFVGTDYQGYLEEKADNIINNTFNNVYFLHLNGDNISSNSLSSARLVNISAVSFTHNTITKNHNLNLNIATGQRNSFSGVGNMNLTVNSLGTNSLTSIEAGFMNISYGNNNSLKSVSCQIDAKNIYSNTFTSCNLVGRIDSFTDNSISGGWIDVDGVALKQNSMNGDNLIFRNGKSFNYNSIHSLKHCDLKYINHVNSNTFETVSNVYLQANFSFVGNSLSNVENFECDIERNTGFSNNSIHAYSLSFKDMDSGIFTNNSFTIGNYLDFNYGSSNVYDASLNYLLSDYVPETKVLGKYNLVPYVRSLMNGGAGAKQSICAYDKNIAAQAQLWTDEIGTLNLNIVNSTNVITSAGATWHGTIDKCFINHWDNKSYGLFSLISFSGDCRIKELIYDRRQNTVEKTGSLFSGNNLFIDTLKYSGITTTAEKWNETSDYYPLARGATISEADLSFSGCQVAHLPLYSNTISKLKMSGSVPYQVGSTLSIRSFFWKDFSTFPSNEGYLGIPFNSCTIDNLYIDTGRLYTNTSVFGHCSIKNAFVVCTPLAWDMSSGSYRSIVREMISMLSNTTTDVPPMSFVSDWPN